MSHIGGFRAFRAHAGLTASRPERAFAPDIGGPLFASVAGQVSHILWRQAQRLDPALCLAFTDLLKGSVAGLIELRGEIGRSTGVGVDPLQ